MEVADQLTIKADKKELTVCVELVEEKVPSAVELMNGVRKQCGVMMGCRRLNDRAYEVTMSLWDGKERLIEGFKIGETTVYARELNNDERVVSFLNLPYYIEDNEIYEKLRSWGVKGVSLIRRRMWPGSKVADGTRYLRVKFNDKVQSLPYSTKFATVQGAEYFRVLHDKQIKVCRLCMQPGHIQRECPEFVCYRCGIQGHYARECMGTNKRCKDCGNAESSCECSEGKGESEGTDEEEDQIGVGDSDSMGVGSGAGCCRGREADDGGQSDAGISGRWDADIGGR